MRALNFFIRMLFVCLTFAIISSCANNDITDGVGEDNGKLVSNSTIKNKPTQYLLFQVYPYVVTEDGRGTAYVKVYTNNYLPTDVQMIFTITLTMKNGSLGPSRNIGVLLRAGQCEGYGTYSCGPDMSSEATATLESMYPSTFEGYTTVVEFPGNSIQ